MAFPTSGLIKIFPSTVSIISGDYALNSDAAPQPNRPVADLQAYFDARVTNLAIAPNIRRATEYPPASGVYVPAINTFELQFSPSSINFEFYDAGYPGAIAATKDFLEADFPMGMTITQPQIWWTGQAFFGPSRDRSIDSLIFKYFGSTVETYTPAGGLLTGSHATPNNAILPGLTSVWSIVQVMKQFGISIPVNSVVSALLSTPRAVTSEFFLLATYNTLAFQTSTTTPNALPGSIVNLTSGQAGFGNLDVNEFKFYWDTLEGETDVNSTFPGWSGGIRVPRNLIFEFTSTFLKLQIPNSRIPYGGRRLMLTGKGNGITFTGEFPLQNYNITLVNGSGLYTLVKDKANDTYYNRATTPVTTIDLKIPDPMVKTGFFNS